MTLDRSILQILICDPLLLAEFWIHGCADLLDDAPVVYLIERAVACVAKVGTGRMWAVAAAQLGDTALETLVANVEGRTVTREGYTDLVCALQDRWIVAEIKAEAAQGVPDIHRLELLQGSLRTVRDQRACSDGRPSCGALPFWVPTLEHVMRTQALIKAYGEKYPRREELFSPVLP